MNEDKSCEKRTLVLPHGNSLRSFHNFQLLLLRQILPQDGFVVSNHVMSWCESLCQVYEGTQIDGQEAAPGWCFRDWISQLHPAGLDDRFQEVELVFLSGNELDNLRMKNNNTMPMPYFWGEEVKYKGNRKHPDFFLVSHFLTGCAMTGWWLTSTIRCHKVAVTVYCFVKHRLWHQTCQYPDIFRIWVFACVTLWCKSDM